MTAPAPLFYRVAPRDDASLTPAPLLILLHGRGSDENDLLGLTPYLDPRFQVVSMRAPRRFSFGGYTWYDLFEIGKPNVDHLVESHGMLHETVGKIQRELPVDPQQAFLLGFSMGAMMSFALALTHPERIRGVVAHSGYIPEGTPLTYRWNDLRSTAFFVAHGTEDPVVPVAMGRHSDELLRSAGASYTYREYPIPHTISDESLNDLSEWLHQRISSDG